MECHAALYSNIGGDNDGDTAAFLPVRYAEVTDGILTNLKATSTGLLLRKNDTKELRQYHEGNYDRGYLDSLRSDLNYNIPNYIAEELQKKYTDVNQCLTDLEHIFRNQVKLIANSKGKWILVNNNPKKISIVAIGPLTNIASAILKNENFARNIKSLIIMGGAENFGNITPYAEFNFYKDPYATSVVFESGIKNIVMIGFNITKKVTLNSDLENMLLNSNDEKAKFLYDITRSSAELDRWKNKADGAIINDAINICYLVNKRVLKLKKAKVEIELSNEERLAESKVFYDKKTNCNVAVDVNNKKCVKTIFKTLFPTIYK
jgi:hypothetical protein